MKKKKNCRLEGVLSLFDFSFETSYPPVSQSVRELESKARRIRKKAFIRTGKVINQAIREYEQEKV